MKTVVYGPSDPSAYTKKIALKGLGQGSRAEIVAVRCGLFRATLAGVHVVYGNGCGIDLAVIVGETYADYDDPNLLFYCAIQPDVVAVDGITANADLYYRAGPREGFLKPGRIVTGDESLYVGFTKGNDFPLDTAVQWWLEIEYDLNAGSELEYVQQLYGA